MFWRCKTSIRQNRNKSCYSQKANEVGKNRKSKFSNFKKYQEIRDIRQEEKSTNKFERRQNSVETEEDIDNVIKLLCDYFKTGDYSGKAYGTYAGKLQTAE